MASPPSDDQFYLDLVAMAARVGAKPEDLLWVWASESALNPALSGYSRTISTLTYASVVPNLLTQAEWDSLPSLSATAQLPFIERLYKQVHDKYLIGRNFQDTFEVYMANAAPGLLRPDGRYNAASVMYGSPQSPAGSTWASNWPLDNYNAAGVAAQKQGKPLNLEFGKSLVESGVLKGWITLGDLRNFAGRADIKAAAQPAIDKLHAVTAANPSPLTGSLAWVPTSGTVPASGGYSPDMTKSFSDPSAPVDTRVAPPGPAAYGAVADPTNRFVKLSSVIVIGLVLWYHLFKRR